MSRIGKKPIPIPEGVKIGCIENTISIEGVKGKITQAHHPLVNVEIDMEGSRVLVKIPVQDKMHKSLCGLTRTLIANNIHGVVNGFSKDLEIVGIGYNVKLQGRDLILQLGFSHPIKMEIPQGLEVEITSQTNPGKLTVKGADKQLVGQFSANIRRLRPPEPYKGKGIKYANEVIRRKAGKAVASAS